MHFFCLHTSLVCRYLGIQFLPLIWSLLFTPEQWVVKLRIWYQPMMRTTLLYDRNHARNATKFKMWGLPFTEYSCLFCKFSRGNRTVGKATTLEPDCLVSNLSSSTYQLCDLGQLPYPFLPHALSIKWEWWNQSAYLIGLPCGLKE